MGGGVMAVLALWRCWRVGHRIPSALPHHRHRRQHHILCIWFGCIIAITGIGWAMRLCRNCPWWAIQMPIATLYLQHLLQHIRTCATGHILIQYNQAAGCCQRLPNQAMDIKRQQCLHIDDFKINTKQCQLLRSSHGNSVISLPGRIISGTPNARV
jgi:hypothetical protein